MRETNENSGKKDNNPGKERAKLEKYTAMMAKVEEELKALEK